jgi:putative flippase GtrA
VGAFNTVFGLLLFALADATIGAALDEAVNPTVGSLATLGISHLGAAVVAFFLYRRFVFRVQGHIVRDFLRFESVYLVSLTVNAVALPALVAAGAPRVLAQVVIVGILAIASYVGHRYFSFRRVEDIVAEGMIESGGEGVTDATEDRADHGPDSATQRRRRP